MKLVFKKNSLRDTLTTMTREEIRLQVAISVIQGVLEAKHGVIGEVAPSVAVAIALRIADAFVEEWYRETKEESEASTHLVDVDAVRDDFVSEVYNILDADPTNDRANAIIDAFDSLPTIHKNTLLKIEKI